MTERPEGPSQIPFDFLPPRRRAMGRGDFFVSASNAEALALIDGWRSWPERRLALVGPAGSGKTHLAHVWMAAANAEKVAAERLSTDDAPLLIEAQAVAVEDADRIAGAEEAERALFHLMNLARERETPILVTGRAAPDRWGIATPDLRSRLAALAVARLDRPDDALLLQLLRKQFDDRGLKVEDAVLEYLSRRMERSAAAVGALVARLDERALVEGRRIDRRLARETLDAP